jgi:aerobic carbon-monoxide dehydrogenase medium subunit
MRPAPFHYEDPRTLAAALELLAEHGDEAAVLAGGQSLVPLMNMRALRPRIVIDINRVPGLDGIELGDDSVRIGALSRARALERDRQLRSMLPVVANALRFVAVPQVRARTTIGGSVAHADPAAEIPAVVAALDGEIELASKEGERTLAWDAFFRAPFATARRPDELLSRVRLQRRSGLRFSFAEVGRRHSAPALVGACVGLARENGTAKAARIALCGVGDGPLRLPASEESLAGAALDEEGLAALRHQVMAELGAHASRGDEDRYRVDVGATLVCRGLRALWEEPADVE